MEPTDRTGPRVRAPQASTRHTPSTTEAVRTCVGCRATDSRSALLRVVADPGGDLIPDERRRLPGRGAWLHPTEACFELAVRRRAFGRALRIAGPVGPDAVAAWINAHTQHTDHPLGTESGFDANEHPMSTQQ